MIKEYRCIEKLCGSMMFIKRLADVRLGELGVARYPSGAETYVTVEEITGEGAWVRLLDGRCHTGARDCSVRFFGHGIRLSLSRDMLGRSFDAMGAPADGGARLIPEKRADLLSESRDRYMKAGFGGEILTGIPRLDEKSRLLRGGSLSLSVKSGQDYTDALLSCVKGFRDSVGADESYAVVLAFIGMRRDETEHFAERLACAGISERTVSFLNYASDGGYMRTVLPYTALACAEYLAFDLGMQVLLVTADISCFADACRVEKGDAADREILRGLGAVLGGAGCRAGASGSVTAVTVATRREDLDGLLLSERVGASSDIKLEL